LCHSHWVSVQTHSACSAQSHPSVPAMRRQGSGRHVSPRPRAQMSVCPSPDYSMMRVLLQLKAGWRGTAEEKCCDLELLLCLAAPEPHSGVKGARLSEVSRNGFCFAWEKCWPKGVDALCRTGHHSSTEWCLMPCLLGTTMAYYKVSHQY